VSAWLATLSLAWLAATVVSAATSLAIALAWPCLRRGLATAHPAARARAALLAAAAPSLLPALLLVVCFAPGLLGALGLSEDHCLLHPEHAHLCLVHPGAMLTPALAAWLGIGAVGLARLGLEEAGCVARARRWLVGFRGATVGHASGVVWIAAARPLSFVAGLLRPRIHVTTALARALPPSQLEAVLAHERAHVRRRDPLARLAARALSRAQIPRVRRALLAEHALACEQACDAAAAQCVGDPLVVAEAILAVERLISRDPAAAPVEHPAFGESSVAERIEALLASEARSWAPAVISVATVASLLALAALAGHVHHATEHVLGQLLALLA